MMSFNPHRAGGTPTGPSVSGGNISQLLNMSQNSGDKAIEALVNFGKLKRSGNVNDLIARGELQGLNEQQSQAKLLEAAGGSINKDTQKTIDSLLGRKKEELKAKALVDAANKQHENTLEINNINYGNELNKLFTEQDFTSNQTDKADALAKLLQRERLSSAEGIASANRANSKAIADERNATSKEVVNSNFLNNLWLNGNKKPKKEVHTVKDGVIVYKDGTTKDYDYTPKEKLGELDKQALKNIKPGEMEALVPDIVEDISEDMDILVDREMTPQTITVMKKHLIDIIQSPGGASTYSQFGMKGLKDLLYQKLESRGESFTDPKWGDRSIQKNK